MKFEWTDSIERIKQSSSNFMNMWIFNCRVLWMNYSTEFSREMHLFKKSKHMFFSKISFYNQITSIWQNALIKSYWSLHLIFKYWTVPTCLTHFWAKIFNNRNLREINATCVTQVIARISSRNSNLEWIPENLWKTRFVLTLHRYPLDCLLDLIFPSKFRNLSAFIVDSLLQQTFY